MTRSSLAAFSVIVFLTASLFAQSNPVPFVNQPLVPTTVVPGSAAFTLTVNGTGFVSGSVVNWNGSPRVTTFVSSSQLTAAILAADVAVASTGTVTVTSPGPGGGVSNGQFLGVTNPFRQITFATKGYGNIPSQPIGLALSDFNGDGKLDLVASTEGGKLSLFLGNGDGTFQPQRDITVEIGNDDLTSVMAADFNGDGKQDLAVVVVETQQLAVLLGNGDGTFGTPAFYSTQAETPENLVVADFNADGFLDVAVTNDNDETVGIFLGNGDGTFKPVIKSFANFSPLTLVAGDFNNDSKLDLTVSPQLESYISVLLGNGDGTFANPTEFQVGINPSPLLTADFNRDGNLDLAIMNYNDAAVDTISMMLGNGNGTFQPPVLYDVGAQNTQIADGDLDGDGNLDLVILNLGNSNNPTISILLGNGDGTFQPQMVYPITADSIMVLGDFNNDGRLDLAIADRVHDNISVMLQIPSVNLAPTALSFVNQEVGITSPAQTVILTNASNSPLTITSISVTGTDSVPFGQTNTCPPSLNPGANCAITVIYKPPLVGSDSATLTVKDSGAPNTQTVALTGNSIGPVVKLSALTLNFGNEVVGTTSAGKIVTLKNNGTLPLNISSIAASGNFTQTNTCGSSVAVGASCTITAKFTPTVIDERTGVITITDNAGPSTQTIHLFGTGTDVSLSTLSLTFAPQKVGTTSPPSSIRLTNVGRTGLTFSSFTISGANAADFVQGNNCGPSLSGGHSCTISVTFTPSATGARNASLAITDNGGGSPQNVTLQGTGK
jgi:hypothetical protein